MLDSKSAFGVVALIVAGGTGERFGREDGKQLAPVGSVPVLAHTLGAFDRAVRIDAVVVVVHPDRVDEYRSVAEKYVKSTPIIGVVGGGETRQDSVDAGIAAVPEGVGTIVIHDGARPLITSEVIDSAVAYLESMPDADGVVVGHPAFDTLKIVDGVDIVSTPDRSRYWIAQTPQVFRAGALRSAYLRAQAEGFLGTDDASLVEAAGGRVLVFEGPRDNLKVTVPEDLAIVESLIARRAGG